MPRPDRLTDADAPPFPPVQRIPVVNTYYLAKKPIPASDNVRPTLSPLNAPGLLLTWPTAAFLNRRAFAWLRCLFRPTVSTRVRGHRYLW